MKRLPLVIAPDARFRCHACGACCRRFRVGLGDGEAERIATHDWAREGPRFRRGFTVDGTDPWGEPQTQLRRRPGGACIFLDEDDLCLVHKRLGHDAKPRICRAFPFVFVRAPDGTRATVSVECASRYRSVDDGGALASQREALEALRGEGTPYRTRWRVRRSKGGTLLTPEEYLALEQRLRQGVMEAASLQAALDALDEVAREQEAGTISATDGGTRLGLALAAVRRVLTADDDRAWLRILDETPAPEAAVRALDTAEPAARFARHALRTWIDQAIPGRAPSFAAGARKIILAGALTAIHATHASADSPPTAAQTNHAAREVSLLVWGRRQDQLDQELVKTVTL